ncbi:MAG: VTT domain-containing protein [Acidimicrobiia bacterium]|nr:VTT domain-containing protein [Acidimicrobiia bacterium]
MQMAVSLLDAESLLRAGGLLALVTVVFVESGLLVGFFLPGDSLLFLAGFLASPSGGQLMPPIWLVMICVVVAAIAGDQVGYSFGRRVGKALALRPENRWFKKSRLDQAEQFAQKYGPKAIVLARFVPIVRTFTPVVAGIGHLDRKVFTRYNVLGGLLWGVGLPGLGYGLGGVALVRNNLESAVLVVIALSLIPAAIQVVRHLRSNET